MVSRSTQQSTRNANSRTAWTLVTLSGVLLGCVGLVQVAGSEPQLKPQAAYEQKLVPFLQKHCYGCHSSNKPSGGIDLAKYPDLVSIQRDQHMWRKVWTQLRERSMPPRGVPQPNETLRQEIVAWLKETLDNVDETILPPDPGAALIHRLTRDEYNNTVRDLFGVTSRPADKFPADGGGGAGFDNNSETLYIPPILLERYLQAADEIVREAPAERIFLVRPNKQISARQAAFRILAQFAKWGYRRPVQPEEVQRLLSLYDRSVKQGKPFEESVRFALKGILVSPNFLFRVEQDRPNEEAYPVSDYELANRLSYFLWASMPDPELFRLAEEKRLRDPKVLDEQIQRMLQSPKAEAFVDSFVSQWLHLRDLHGVTQPDPRRYPSFTPNLRDAMYREPVELFAHVLRQNGSLLELLDAKYTFVNEDLAKHYGIPGVTGSEFRQVALNDPQRGGVMTMAGVLTVTSYPRRTSPVLRGKWLLEEILGADVPPPPPNAGGLPAEDAPREGLTFRQRLEKHREKPECASCHSRMDPLGFSLENFDVIGRWRTQIGSEPVDASGELATGEKFAGPDGLKQVIMARKEEFTQTLAEKMFAYALGRGLEPYDIPAVRKITATLANDGYRSQTLIREVVKSYAFQYRKSF